jgi:hypothetical protein
VGRLERALRALVGAVDASATVAWKAARQGAGEAQALLELDERAARVFIAQV